VQFDLTEGRFSAGDASLYARPNDIGDFARKLCELLDDPELRARLGAIGRSRIEAGLAWHHQIPRLLEAYETAMKQGAAHAKSFDRQSG
jgi:glycosyltransferase involved in cell wall biosynthesis